MVKWPFQWLSDPEMADEKVTLNHLVYIYNYIIYFLRYYLCITHNAYLYARTLPLTLSLSPSTALNQCLCVSIGRRTIGSIVKFIIYIIWVYYIMIRSIYDCVFVCVHLHITLLLAYFTWMTCSIDLVEDFMQWSFKPRRVFVMSWARVLSTVLLPRTTLPCVMLGLTLYFGVRSWRRCCWPSIGSLSSRL